MVKEVSVAAGPGGMAAVDRLDAACDAIDERDEHFSDGGKLMMLLKLKSNQLTTLSNIIHMACQLYTDTLQSGSCTLTTHA